MGGAMADSDLRTQFRARRLRQILLVIPFLPLMIAIATADKQTGDTWLGLSEGALLFALLPMVLLALVFSLMNWRCPACNRYLGKQLWVRHCPQCGVQLAGD